MCIYIYIYPIALRASHHRALSKQTSVSQSINESINQSFNESINQPKKYWLIDSLFACSGHGVQPTNKTTSKPTYIYTHGHADKHAYNHTAKQQPNPSKSPLVDPLKPTNHIKKNWASKVPQQVWYSNRATNQHHNKQQQLRWTTSNNSWDELPNKPKNN